MINWKEWDSKGHRLISRYAYYLCVRLQQGYQTRGPTSSFCAAISLTSVQFQNLTQLTDEKVFYLKLLDLSNRPDDRHQ